MTRWGTAPRGQLLEHARILIRAQYRHYGRAGTGEYVVGEAPGRGSQAPESLGTLRRRGEAHSPAGGAFRHGLSATHLGRPSKPPSASLRPHDAAPTPPPSFNTLGMRPCRGRAQTTRPRCPAGLSEARFFPPVSGHRATHFLASSARRKRSHQMHDMRDLINLQPVRDGGPTDLALRGKLGDIQHPTALAQQQFEHTQKRRSLLQPEQFLHVARKVGIQAQDEKRAASFAQPRGRYFHRHLRLTMRCWPWQSVQNFLSGWVPASTAWWSGFSTRPVLRLSFSTNFTQL